MALCDQIRELVCDQPSIDLTSHGLRRGRGAVRHAKQPIQLQLEVRDPESSPLQGHLLIRESGTHLTLNTLLKLPFKIFFLSGLKGKGFENKLQV